MARLNGQVTGTVSYREGDGVLIEILRGPCVIEIGDLDHTLSWFEGDVHCSTAMPRSNFDRYVADGDLVLE